jgi:hypothetical protein
MTTNPHPVVITHPGCDVEPMRCGPCAKWTAYEYGGSFGECSDWHQQGDAPECEHDFGCIDWRCRECGGEIKRD